ncbi:MAG: nicotianamine synthase [Dactylosporangium sp.]|nr:hypothetical protein [Dactylosporangium sp.]NNJ63322.1 nicotianamine synthase [Dactylosporangium sp.]
MLKASAASGVPTNPTSSRCRRILALYQRLRAQDSPAPSPVVNALFADLVSACVRAETVDARSVLEDPRIHEVRSDLIRLCAEGEGLLERDWARRALAAEDPQAETAAFPYRDNYEQLARFEAHALAGAGYDPGATRRACFIGGGPLPLSGVLLYRNLTAEVTIVDRDAEAVDLSARLVGRLVPGGGIRVMLADATSDSDMVRAACGCDVVVLAALVGLTRTQKQVVLRAVGAALKPGAHLVVRSAEGLRSLLYPVVDIRDVRDAGFVPEALVHPLGEVVNSVLVARRR